MELLAIIFLCALLAALILPWVNLGRLNRHRTELNRLKFELHQLKNASAQPVEPVESGEHSVVSKPVVELDSEEAVSSAPPPIPKIAQLPELSPGVFVVSEDLLPAAAAAHAKADTKVEEEPQDWFSKIAVWVGGIALLMAGFYMVKYSIDSGWLTPAVRVGLTAVFGILLCASGLCIGIKAKLAGSERIGQALSGAGVACLYFASYAAVHLYHLLGSGQGFACMVLATLLAVALSLKNGAPVALMGLVGGFLTPFLMQTDTADTVLLFNYLFLLFCGTQFLCIRRGWWGMMLGSLVAVHVWSLYVIGGNLGQPVQYLEGAMLFVIGICVVNAVWTMTMSRAGLTNENLAVISFIQMLAWGGGLFQSLALVWISGFSGVDMTLFALLSIGALSLAVFKEEEFIWASWLALAAVAVATLACPDVFGARWYAWPSAMLLLFFVVGHWHGLSSGNAVLWRGLSMSAVLSLAPLIYVNRLWVVELSGMLEGFWLAVSAGSAVCMLLAAEHLLRRDESRDTVGEYTAFTWFLLVFGLWTYVDAEFFAPAVSGLWIAGLVYWEMRDLGRVHLMQTVLGLVWLVLMSPLAVEAFEYFLRERYIDWSHQDGIAIWSWCQGCAALGLASYLLREKLSEQQQSIMKWCLGIGALFSLVATYQMVDQTYLPKVWLSVTVEGGLTALLALLAVGFSHVATRYRRGMGSSYLLMALVMFRIFILHLGDAGAEGESFFFNALILQFGIPFIGAFVIAWMCGKAHQEVARKVYQIMAMSLGFVWCSFLVQDYFGARYLLPNHPTSVQIYTYSVVWLVLAVAYQSIGLWRNQRVIHGGSLALLLLTVGKVFLVDASELEGIFRVFSFLGLGVALIGIGFFYNKVVFARQQSDENPSIL
ncbi:MAG: DUF2339 domain-containing protein [Lentimonas sp.]